MSNWRRKRREKGLCWDCNSLATEGKIRCLPCRTKHNTGNRLNRLVNGDTVRTRERKSKVKCMAIRRSKGICRWCSRRVSTGSVLCALCLYKLSHARRDKDKRRREAHIERQKRLMNNRCCRCGAPLMDGEVKYCFGCLAARKGSNVKGVFANEVAN